MENINLEFYKVFYNVAKYSSLTKASEVLYVSQPAVTQTIKKLEEQLGGKLFYRQAKGVTLTVEGQNLYNLIESGIESLNNASSRFSEHYNLENGTIRINCVSTVGEAFVYDKLTKFLKDYPNIKLEMSNSISKRSMIELSNGEVDIIFVANPKDIEKNNIELTTCYEDRLVAFATEDYLKSLEYKIETINDLAKSKLIATKSGSNTRNLLDNFFKERNIEFSPEYEVTSSLARLKLAQAGCGIGIGYESYIKNEVKSKKVKILKLDESLPKSQIVVATLKKDICNFATLKFLEYLTNDDEEKKK